MVRCEQCKIDTSRDVWFEQITTNHLRSTHNMDYITYKFKFPEALLIDEDLRLRRNLSVEISKTGITHSEEWNSNISKGSKANGSTEDRKNWIDNIIKGQLGIGQFLVSRQTNNTSSFNEDEKELDSILRDFFPTKYRYVGNLDFPIGDRYPDFVHTSEKKIIEYFGSHWHTPYEEKDRTDYFSNYGYSTLVIWNWQLKRASKSPVDFNRFLNKIKDFTYRLG